MRIEMTHMLVDEHIQRLREAAQAPTSPLLGRIWAVVRRRRQPAPKPQMAQSSAVAETDRLAA